MSQQTDIHSLVHSHPVVLFMKGNQQFPQCGFSAQAVEILHASGCRDFLAVNVLEDDRIRQEVKQYSNWPTLPQLYIKGEFIGGSDIMLEMFENKELQPLLANV